MCVGSLSPCRLSISEEVVKPTGNWGMSVDKWTERAKDAFTYFQINYQARAFYTPPKIYSLIWKRERQTEYVPLTGSPHKQPHQPGLDQAKSWASSGLLHRHRVPSAPAIGQRFTRWISREPDWKYPDAVTQWYGNSPQDHVSPFISIWQKSAAHQSTGRVWLPPTLQISLVSKHFPYSFITQLLWIVILFPTGYPKRNFH